MDVKIKKKPLARSLLYKSKKYRTARKAFRWVAGAVWIGATLIIFYNQKMNKHEQVPEEEIEQAHSRVRRAMFGSSSSPDIERDQLAPEDSEYYPYQPKYTEACRAQLRDCFGTV